MSTQKNEPRALALGVSCYVIWGFFPLYFSLLSPAGAVEVIVHRAVWGLFFCVVALAVTGSLGKIRALIADRGALWRLAVAGALVVVNWSVYVYAVLSPVTASATRQKNRPHTARWTITSTAPAGESSEKYRGKKPQIT